MVFVQLQRKRKVDRLTSLKGRRASAGKHRLICMEQQQSAPSIQHSLAEMNDEANKEADNQIDEHKDVKKRPVVSCTPACLPFLPGVEEVLLFQRSYAQRQSCARRRRSARGEGERGARARRDKKRKRNGKKQRGTSLTSRTSKHIQLHFTDTKVLRCLL